MLYYVHFDLKKSVTYVSRIMLQGGRMLDISLFALKIYRPPPRPGKLKTDFLIAWVTVCPLLLAYKIQSAC